MDFVLSANVETYAAAVVITSPVAVIPDESVDIENFDIKSSIIEEARDVDLNSSVFEGTANPYLTLTGDTQTFPNEGDVIMATDVIVEGEGETPVNLSLAGVARSAADVDIDLISVGTIFSAEPFYASKLVVEEGTTGELSLESLILQGGATDIYGTVIEMDENASVDIISPLNIFGGAIISNFDIPADVVVNEYNANVTLAAYSALLTVPLQQTADVVVGAGTTLSLLASIENLNFMLSTDIADSGSIRYEVADIDRNLQEGRLRIFPNEWTLTYINNPVDSSGNMNTVSSFLLPILEAAYGTDIYTKISLITARNPVTGVLYNFVLQDGYITPSGTVNDFDLCYKEDGVFYPIPFMVKSITNEELEIAWDLGQEV